MLAGFCVKISILSSRMATIQADIERIVWMIDTKDSQYKIFLNGHNPNDSMVKMALEIAERSRLLPEIERLRAEDLLD